MAEIPANLPWIPSFGTWLEAMHSGASLGLQRAHLAQQAAETGARLRLQQQQEEATRREFAEKQRMGWAQLGVDRETSLARLAQARSQQEAALALKESQLESLNAYRRLESKTAQDRLDSSKAHGLETAGLAAQNLELRRSALEGQNDRAAAILRAHSDYQSKLDRRQRLEYQIGQLTKQQAADPMALLAGAPEPKEPGAHSHWQRVRDRQKQIDDLTQQLQTGFGGVSGGGEAGAAPSVPAYTRDPKTGKLVIPGQASAQPAGATLGAPASLTYPGGSMYGVGPAPVTGPASYLTGAAPAPAAPPSGEIDTLTPGAQLTPGWMDQAGAAYQ